MPGGQFRPVLFAVHVCSSLHAALVGGARFIDATRSPRADDALPVRDLGHVDTTAAAQATAASKEPRPLTVIPLYPK
ncbi:hypothetical protein GCM10027360_71810 [Amycolatopsis echigonensis]